MYHQYYQLKENPFNVTADPDFFFASNHHAEAISNLIYGIKQRKGISVITGEVGTGKTTLCRKLLKETGTDTRYAFILNPEFSELQLLQMIVHDLGIATQEKSKFGLICALNDFLLTETNKGFSIALVIDEAQNLSVKQLEQVRLLSNLETEKEKLLQILLVGQPELYTKLQLPSLRQLRQRIGVFYSLKTLDKNDISHYINHRLNTAVINHENNKPVVFTEPALDSIYYYTQGSPRSINLLCDRALIAGFVAETHSIDETIIQHCAKEVLYFEHYL